MFITQSELAKKLDVSPQYINKLVKQGVLPLHEGSLLNENECINILNERDVTKANESMQQDNKINQYYRKARAVKMTNEAELARVELQNKNLKLQELRNKYINKENGLKDIILMTDNLKGLINELPIKLSQSCTNKSAVEIYVTIENAINDVMQNAHDFGVAELKKIQEHNDALLQNNESQ